MSGKTFTVTEADLDKAIAARKPGERISRVCVLAQALIRQGVNLDGCASRSYTERDRSAPNGFRSFLLTGARELVDNFDMRRYEAVRDMLPLQVVATGEWD